MSPLLLQLFVLIFIATSKFPPAAPHKCFHCTHETSPLCQEELRDERGKGRELITECDGNGYAGCVQFLISYMYPLEVFLYRGCYHTRYDQPNCFQYVHRNGLTEWVSKAPQLVDCLNGVGWVRTPQLIFRKHLREDSGDQLIHVGSTDGLSNGIAFAKMAANPKYRNAAFEINHWKETWMEYTKQVEGLKCFVCSDSTSPSCEGALTPAANPALAKVCPKGKDGTSAIGCTTMIFQFDYPVAPYVFRDCLYPPYFKCFDLGRPFSPDSLMMFEKDSSTWNPFQRKSNIVTLLQYINCINRERIHLGLDENQRLMVNSYTLPHRTEFMITTQRLHFVEARSTAHPTSWDLRNREAVAGLISPPNDVPEEREYECYICDTRNPYEQCDSTRGEGVPVKKCGAGAYGCAVLFSEVGNGTAWFRRECWYNGDLGCLKERRRKRGSGLQVQERTLGAARPIPGSSRTLCNARKLLGEGRWLHWYGRKMFQDEQDFEAYLECRRRARKAVTGLDPAEWDTVPRANELFQNNGSSSFINKTLIYHFCSEGSLEPCNDMSSHYGKYPPFVKPATTTTPSPPSPPTTTPSPPSPPTTTPSPPSPPTATTDDRDDNDCVCVNCPKKSDAAAGSSRRMTALLTLSGLGGGALQWLVLGRL